MVTSIKSVIELIQIAKCTTSVDILDDLKTSSNMNVRRAVAKNINATTKILNDLVVDPVLNVSYVASLHKNCTEKREFYDITNPCVLCEKDEDYLECSNCNQLREYS